MSLEEKIRNAKETDWITDGIPKWQVSLIVFFTKLKVKCRRLLHIQILGFIDKGGMDYRYRKQIRGNQKK